MPRLTEKEPTMIPVRESDAKKLLPIYIEAQKEIRQKMKDLLIEESYNRKFIIELRKLLDPKDGGYSPAWSWEEKCEFILKTSEKSSLTSRQIAEQINEYEPNYELNSIISSVSGTLSVKSNPETGTFTRKDENGVAYYSLRNLDPIKRYVRVIKRFRNRSNEDE